MTFLTDEQIDNAIFAADVQGYSYTDDPAGYRAVVRSLLAAAAPHAQAPAQQESIDSSQYFGKLLSRVAEFGFNGGHEKALIEYIDQHTAAAVAKAREQMQSVIDYEQRHTAELEVALADEHAKLRKAEAALAQPVDLSKLTRYDMRSEYNKFACEDQVIPVEDPQGDYVCFADVEQLLAAAPAAPYPTRECEIGISIINSINEQKGK